MIWSISCCLTLRFDFMPGVVLQVGAHRLLQRVERLEVADFAREGIVQSAALISASLR